MICPKCHAAVPDDSDFCPSCGAPISSPPPGSDENAQTPPLPAEEEIIPAPPAPKKKDPLSGIPAFSFQADYIGAIIGVVCIIIGLVFFATTASSVHSTSFGADFYTYTYQGIVAVVEVGVKLIKLLSLMLILAGALVDCHYVQKILKKRQKEM